MRINATNVKTQGSSLTDRTDDVAIDFSTSGEGV